MSLIGYDCDGVLVPEMVKPTGNFVIITGRLFTEWSKTLAEVGHYGMPRYLRPYGESGDGNLAAFWKAEMIKNLNITKFYEDNEAQAGIIKKLCPFCELVLVKSQSEYKILLIESKTSWIGKLVHSKQGDICVGKSFHHNEKSRAIESIKAKILELGISEDILIEEDPWYGC